MSPLGPSEHKIKSLDDFIEPNRYVYFIPTKGATRPAARKYRCCKVRASVSAMTFVRR